MERLQKCRTTFWAQQKAGERMEGTKTAAVMESEEGSYTLSGVEDNLAACNEYLRAEDVMFTQAAIQQKATKFNQGAGKAEFTTSKAVSKKCFASASLIDSNWGISRSFFVGVVTFTVNGRACTKVS